MKALSALVTVVCDCFNGVIVRSDHCRALVAAMEMALDAHSHSCTFRSCLTMECSEARQRISALKEADLLERLEVK